MSHKNYKPSTDLIFISEWIYYYREGVNKVVDIAPPPPTHTHTPLAFNTTSLPNFRLHQIHKKGLSHGLYYFMTLGKQETQSNPQNNCNFSNLSLTTSCTYINFPLLSLPWNSGPPWGDPPPTVKNLGYSGLQNLSTRVFFLLHGHLHIFVLMWVEYFSCQFTIIEIMSLKTQYRQIQIPHFSWDTTLDIYHLPFRKVFVELTFATEDVQILQTIPAIPGHMCDGKTSNLQ